MATGRVFQTVEDLFTQSYVLPYLVPMLENAGANVLVPRERDTQVAEVIIDNDNNCDTSIYSEINTDKEWQTGSSPGFAHFRNHYVDFENPFKEGDLPFHPNRQKERKTGRVDSFYSLKPAIMLYMYPIKRWITAQTMHCTRYIIRVGSRGLRWTKQWVAVLGYTCPGHFSFDKGKTHLGKWY